FTSNPARVSTGARFHDWNAFHAASTAFSTCSFFPLEKRPRICDLWEGLIDSKVGRPVMCSPPMTSGYSRPNSCCTFCNAASIADLFSGLVKSVSGSFLNSDNGDILGLLHAKYDAAAAVCTRKAC